MSDRRRDLVMLRHPDRWPRWPVLPLVRGATVGCLMADSQGYVLLYCNIYALPRSAAEFEALRKEVYATAEAVLDAGWEVD